MAKRKKGIESIIDDRNSSSSTSSPRLKSPLGRSDPDEYQSVLADSISPSNVMEMIAGRKPLEPLAATKVGKELGDDTEIFDQEMVDDPVRMYLREIGRVRLLSARDERILARKMEGGKHITKVKDDLEERNGRPPSAWEIYKSLLTRLATYSDPINVLGREVGLIPPITIGQVVSHPKIREVFDGEIEEEFSKKIVNGEADSPNDVGNLLVLMSIDARLLPVELMEILGEDLQLGELEGVLLSAEFNDILSLRNVRLDTDLESIGEGKPERRRQRPNG